MSRQADGRGRDSQMVFSPRLWLIVLLSAAAYLALALYFPLIPNVGRIPPVDIRDLAPSLAEGLAYATLIVGLFGLMIAAARRLVKGEGLVAATVKRQTAIILLVGFLLGLPLVFVYPINAIDVFTYYLQGRVAAVHGANPYLIAPALFPSDPYLGLTGEWVAETPPYGPLWVLFSSAVAAAARLLGGDELLVALLLFKLLGLVFFVLCGVVLSRMLGSGPRRAALLALFAWNPALHLEFVANAHNDVLMLLFLLLGYHLVILRRPLAGFLVMVLAALTKPVALLALPIVFLYVLVKLDDNRRRLTFAAAASVGALALAALTFWPFMQADAPLATIVGLGARLLREAAENSGFSLPVLLWFGAGGGLSLELIGRVATALFLAYYLWLLLRTIGGREATRGIADAFGGYLFSARGFRIWYAAWPFPWLLLDAAASPQSSPAGYRLRTGLWFLLTAQLSVVIYGYIRVNWLGGQQSLAHLIGVPFTFLLPLWLARFPSLLPIDLPEESTAVGGDEPEALPYL